MRIARRERIHCSCGSFIRANGEQRVAIWWRTHDGLSSDIAAGARPVLNDELLTELLEELLTYYARDDVNRLARANPTMMRTGRDGYACSGSPPGGPTCASTSRVPPFHEYRFWNRPYQ
jgi:hypothetical protein